MTRGSTERGRPHLDQTLFIRKRSRTHLLKFSHHPNPTLTLYLFLFSSCSLASSLCVCVCTKRFLHPIHSFFLTLHLSFVSYCLSIQFLDMAADISHGGRGQGGRQVHIEGPARGGLSILSCSFIIYSRAHWHTHS